MRRSHTAAALLIGGLVTALVTACRDSDSPPVRATSARDASRDTADHTRPGYVVDSVVPIEQALRRFRAGLAPATRLDGGAPSRDRLLRSFVRAVERGDTAALRRMELSRAEFAYLFYPSSIYTHRPFREQPEIVWMLQRAHGSSGLRRLVERYAGRPLGYDGYECAPRPVVQERNRLWRDCVVRYRRVQGDTTTGHLFGAIIERDGRFKFVNFANDL